MATLNEEGQEVIARYRRHICRFLDLGYAHTYPIVTVVCLYPFVSFVRALALDDSLSIDSLLCFTSCDGLA